MEAHSEVRKVLMHGRAQPILKKNDAYQHTTVRVGDWVKFFRSSDKKSVSQRWFGPAEAAKITDGSAFLFFQGRMFQVPLNFIMVRQDDPYTIDVNMDFSELPLASGSLPATDVAMGAVAQPVSMDETDSGPAACSPRSGLSTQS